MDISVIIPCLNGQATLTTQVAALQDQTFQGEWEVILADNNSNDSSVEIFSTAQVSRYERIIVTAKQKGINYARNAGLEVARGKLIAFCDVDDAVDPDWLLELWNAHEDGHQLIGGDLIVQQGHASQVIAGVTDRFRFLPYPTGANCAASRVVFNSIGFFDTSYRGGGDETDLFWRAQLAGYPLHHCKQAVVRYSQRLSYLSAWHQGRSYGRSNVVLYVKYRALGMPRRSLLRSVAVLGWAILHLVGPIKERRLAAVKRLGESYGRLQASIRLGEFYL